MYLNIFKLTPLLTGICIVLMSATVEPSLASEHRTEPSDAGAIAAASALRTTRSLQTAGSPRTTRLGFFKKMVLRMYLRKLRKPHLLQDSTANADKNATASLWLGIASIVFLFIPTYTLFLVIPLGILAIVFGRHAVQEGTKKQLAAKVGKALGLGALIAFTVLVILLLVFLSTLQIVIVL
jgi:predicted ferric reductase